MPSCRVCGAEIESLNWVCEGVVTYGRLLMLYDDAKIAGLCEDSADDSRRKDSFHCPECSALLFTDTGTAKGFLLRRASAVVQEELA